MKNKIEERIKELENYFKEELSLIKKDIDKSKVVDLFSITTYKQVCEELKEKQESCPYKQIKQIEKLFNGDWKKDWNNLSQYKHYPYFNYNPSSGLVGFYNSVVVAYGSGGSFAYFKSKEISNHVGKNFFSIYDKLIKE